jgi:hypothetical protein
MLLPLVPILFLPVVTNIATNALPASWTPYLWLAWPLAIVLAIPIGWIEVRRQQHIRTASSNTSVALPARLSGYERRKLHDVIVRSYSSADDLLRALRHEPGFNYSPLLDGRSNLDDVVVALVSGAEDDGQLPTLLQVIIRDRPDVKEFRELAWALGYPIAESDVVHWMRSPEAYSRRHGRSPIKVVLWGPNNSGKSVYLAALPLASIRDSSAPESWTVVCADAATRRFVLDGVQSFRQSELLVKSERTTPLAFRVHHSLPLNSRMSRIRARAARDIVVELKDVPGEVFMMAEEEILYDLESSRGLIFFFDPVDDTSSLNFASFYRTILELASRMSNAGRLKRGRLPHTLAVCITKFDDERVFCKAHERGYVTLDPGGRGVPVISDVNAAALFDDLCDESVPANDAALIRGTLARFFYPDRVKYFAISSLGFYIQPDGTFNPHDPSNLVDIHNLRLRGEVRPAGVLELLLQLVNRIERGSWDRATRQRQQ